MLLNDLKNNNIIVSGMRPTGNIHIGNYNAVIKNWISLQDKTKCFFFVADIHSLTTKFYDIYNLKKRTKEMISEWLSCGINPDKAVIYIQSYIPEILELNTYISMIVNLNRLERIPTYKVEKNNNNSYGFLGYPILQASDILILNANYVPVGEDQVAHIDFVREIARKINFDTKKKVFNEPFHLLYKHKKILGTDGKKMSKSCENTIYLKDIGVELKNKINKYFTDPNRIYRYEAGDPDICCIWKLHEIYSNEIEKAYINNSCRNAKIGCTDCKLILFNNIEKQNLNIIKSIRLYEKKEKYINDIIEKGIIETRNVAKKNLESFKIAYNLI